MLFVTFKEMYGISFTLLGTLVLVNFCTQLAIDLVFTFFTDKFNLALATRAMPFLSSVGMMVFCLVPWFFPDLAYVGLLVGTVIFSMSAGLAEVLLSPIVAALPSKNPERDMSFLHSLYAIGVLIIVVISSVYFLIFGTQTWNYLMICLAVLPMISFVLFCLAPIPEMTLGKKNEKKSAKKRNTGLLLCVLCIFLGGAAEVTMTNWICAYLETALDIPKLWGDLIGLALFAALLGAGRLLYSRFGRNIYRVLFLGMVGASVCYIVAGISSVAVISTIACAMTGFCTSMLWPGTLIMMEEEFHDPGVSAYALMAAGGDFGASVAPQMLGIVVDGVTVSAWASSLASSLSLTSEQVGMKVGMLVAAIFPVLGAVAVFATKRYFAAQKNKEAAKI